MDTPLQGLRFPDGLDAQQFLRDYWQQRPLLMRQALPASRFALDADELAGLACEPEFESRLLLKHTDSDWSVRHGPFDAADFADLPERDWTLLVQDVDKFLPQVDALIDAFPFVPGWRIDDIMISYAVDGGGVGPHTDAYDVFLMQAHGRRRWRLSRVAYTEQDLLPDCEQRILARFVTDDDWTLEPGDVLYLPPGVAHWGTAVGECMTWSLGFRAPNQQELAVEWFQWLTSRAAQDRQLYDPPGLSATDPGHIAPATLRMAGALLGQLPGTDSPAFGLWLGRHLTESKPQFRIEAMEAPLDEPALCDRLAAGIRLRRHPAARIAWADIDADQVALFCHGRSFTVPVTLRALARHLAARRRPDNRRLLDQIQADPAAATLILELVNAGLLEINDD